MPKRPNRSFRLSATSVEAQVAAVAMWLVGAPFIVVAWVRYQTADPIETRLPIVTVLFFGLLGQAFWRWSRRLHAREEAEGGMELVEQRRRAVGCVGELLILAAVVAFVFGAPLLIAESPNEYGRIVAPYAGLGLGLSCLVAPVLGIAGLVMLFRAFLRR